ncbi:nitroreductase family protein [Candidatus Formimonas warabiya]|uniref:Nitroreductase n=1 Tax=Formimonas warabiya TaxID=1761012 RepID=A0A3G1KWJ8_FORW1|nr:nitroreductase [Candidatus Formimonas warabiya]ATW26868.1 nitroreductase [Candidatus Formimonas warabiya]
MNETLYNILTRRSIRQYQQKQLKDEEVQSILEAGQFAPSAMNQQSWHITVVQSKEMLQKINGTCRAVFLKSGVKNMEERGKAENFSPFYHAPTFIIVCGEANAIAPQNDGSLALGNMLLAAHSLGIGSCWIHAMNYVFSTEEGKALKKELGIPEGYVSVGAAAFGYKAGESPAPAPRKEGTVHIIK